MHKRASERSERFEPVVEGPMGLPMPEATARRIEQLAKALPREFTYRRLNRKSDEFRLEPGERTDVSRITTDALDRDGEVVLPEGIDWSGYNRVVTFAHRYDQLPVGSNWWIRARGSALIAKTHYPAKPADWGDATPWLPSAVLHLMQQPVPTCTGKSIGFLPLSVRDATAAERSARPELAGVPIIDKAAGIEYAVVPVPANSEAQMEAVAKGRELGLIDDAVEELIRKSAEALANRGADATGGEAATVTPPGEGVSEPHEDNPLHGEPASFVRSGTLRQAIEREVLSLRPMLRQQVREQMREVIARAMGRV